MKDADGRVDGGQRAAIAGKGPLDLRRPQDCPGS